MLIFKNNISVEDFSSLRRHAGFIEYSKKDVELALKNTLYSVVVYSDDKAIGIGRVVGDGRIAFFIKDIIVSKEYQAQGIGTKIMKNILDYINSVAATSAYVGLMSTVNMEGFYEKFGFIRRPNENYGSGMVMFINEEIL